MRMRAARRRGQCACAHVQVLEAKRLVVDEQMGASRAQVLEQARAKLVAAMRFGHTLYIRLANCACDFRSRYASPASPRHPIHMVLALLSRSAATTGGK